MADRANRGIALISVLWITGLLAVMAASFASSTRTETRLAHNQEENAKAEALVDAVRRLLGHPECGSHSPARHHVCAPPASRKAGPARGV